MAEYPEGFQQFVQEQRRSYEMIEGSISEEETRWMFEFLRDRPNIQRVLEIGFNGGRSAAIFLSARPDLTMVSFDIGQWPYVPAAKKLIDRLFPGRHELVMGDSRETVPAYYPEALGTFDLVFVDGGHHGDVPHKDILNSLPFMKPDGVMIVDDYDQHHPGCADIVQAYAQAIDAGVIRTIGGPYRMGNGWIMAEKA